MRNMASSAALRGDVIARHLERQRGNIDVVKKVKVDVGNIENDRRGSRRQCHANGSDVATAQHTDGTLAVTLAHRLAHALAVEKTLHGREKRHELVVVALLKVRGISGEFVGHFLPGTCRYRVQKIGAVILDL